MTALKLTKYNPDLKDVNGMYNGNDEWTDFYSFLEYRHSKLTEFCEYTNIEDKYVNCILQLLGFFKINCLISTSITDFRKEPWAKEYFIGLKDLNLEPIDTDLDIDFDFDTDIDTDIDKVVIMKDDFITIIKLFLRGLLVGPLYSLDRSFELNIGEDMYVFIIYPNNVSCDYSAFKCKGLYIESYDESWL